MDFPSGGKWLDDLAIRGRGHFTTVDLQAGLGVARGATHAALSRLRRSGRIASPYRGFYVVVAPEHRRLGCPPAEYFIDPLMRWVERPYYVALLSAAALHGAAHQAPLRTQVIVPRRRRAIRCGSVYVDFIVRSDMDKTPVILRNTPVGTMRVATAEATALEIVGYDDRCGGLSHVATVLSELAEVVRPEALQTVARSAPVAWAQRLGWLLDLVGRPTLAESLLDHVQRRATVPTRLVPSVPAKGARRDERWKILINSEVVADEL